MTNRVTILGGGVMGLCAATELSARGLAVTLVDPAGPAPGPHACSWWAGGMLAPDCEGETAEEPVTRLGREAAGWWAAQGVKVHPNGSIVVTLDRDRAELDRFARRTSGHQTLDKTALATLEPDLDRFDTALHFTDEGHLTPRDALTTLCTQLAARGVEFTETTPDDGAQVINCTGLAARAHLPDLRGVKGEMLVLRCPEIALNRPVRLLHPRFPLYITPRGDGVFMLGATQIESGERRRATVRSVVELLNAAYALHPAFAEAELVEIGADARPAFPDNLPRIRRRDGVIYANGLFRHGFLLAPAMARMLTEWLCEGITPEVCDED